MIYLNLKFLLYAMKSSFAIAAPANPKSRLVCTLCWSVSESLLGSCPIGDNILRACHNQNAFLASFICVFVMTWEGRMNLQKLSRLDLNLLVALQALLEERSVIRQRSACLLPSRLRAGYCSSCATSSMIHCASEQEQADSNTQGSGPAVALAQYAGRYSRYGHRG